MVGVSGVLVQVWSVSPELLSLHSLLRLLSLLGLQSSLGPRVQVWSVSPELLSLHSLLSLLSLLGLLTLVGVSGAPGPSLVGVSRVQVWWASI